MRSVCPTICAAVCLGACTLWASGQGAPQPGRADDAQPSPAVKVMVDARDAGTAGPQGIVVVTGGDEIRPTGDASKQVIARIWATGAGPGKLVSLEIVRAEPGAALRQLAAAADEELVLDGEIPRTPLVTLSLTGAHLTTALDMITQMASLGWVREVRPSGRHIGQTVIRVSRALNGGLTLPVFGNIEATAAGNADSASQQLRVLRAAAGGPLAERRRTFTCPHCRGQATIVKRTSLARCAKCGLQMAEDWRMCPRDGAPRPAAAAAWRYCPMCGKRLGGHPAP